MEHHNQCLKLFSCATSRVHIIFGHCPKLILIKDVSCSKHSSRSQGAYILVMKINNAYIRSNRNSVLAEGGKWWWLEIEKLSWLIQMGLNHNHKCPYMRKAGGDLTRCRRCEDENKRLEQCKEEATSQGL